MSFVVDQISRIDAQLDRIHLQTQSGGFSAASGSSKATATTARTTSLQSLIKALSVDSSATRPLLSARRLQWYLSQARFTSTDQQHSSTAAQQGTIAQLDGAITQEAATSEYEQELEWLLVSKAVTQTYGLALDRLLNQTVSMADDVYYWDEVLTRWRWTVLYSVQTSPLRLWDFGSAVWEDARRRAARFDITDAGGQVQRSVTARWGEFYGLVRQVIGERGVARVRESIVSPVARVRAEIRSKQAKLRHARLRGANALGILLGEGLLNECVHGDGLSTPQADDDGRRWKSNVARNVALIDAVLAKVNQPDLDVDKFDAAIGEETDDDALYNSDLGISVNDDGNSSAQVHPAMVADRLVKLLSTGLHSYDVSSKAITAEHGRPSFWVRYWLPTAIGILSSTTLLRIVANRKAEIVAWIQDLGATIIDFWTNWVVEPTRKVIKTIRHDEGSEVSIMSKRSLEGDRESLERMVVQFAIDNPANATAPDASGTAASALTESQIADIRAKVREGDLTPVLRAYEKDLASPFMGTVRGNLIRALLIQVQKTKVDVEVAMGGIDALLKSQELVFGFVGLTPGILVTFAVGRWLRGALAGGGKRGDSSSRNRDQGVMIRQLRNIDRILTDARPTDFGELYYKDQGLLLCEIHVLRREARRAMPDLVYREFGAEMDELADVRSGVRRQRDVVGRCRWAYARWF